MKRRGRIGGGLLADGEKRRLYRDIQIVSRHVLSPGELAAMASCPGKDFTASPDEEDRARVEGKVASVKFTALKRWA